MLGRKSIGRLLVLFLLTSFFSAASAFPVAVKEPSEPARATGSAGRPAEVGAQLAAAWKAFQDRFDQEVLYNPGLTAAGLSYPEKEALREIPPAALLAAVEAGLKTAGSQLEAFFWLDLVSLLPDRLEGAGAVLLGYLRSDRVLGHGYLRYRLVQVHLERLLSAADAEQLTASLGEYESGLQYNLLWLLGRRGLLTQENMARLLRDPRVDATAILIHCEPVSRDTFTWLAGIFPSLPARTQATVARWIGERARWEQQPALKSAARAWLKESWAKAKDPGVRQELCYQLWQAAGVRAALDQLVAEVEKQGAAPGLHFWGNHDFLRRIRVEYPESYLARGFTAYEKVRGRPYFVLDFWDPMAPGPWPFKYGDNQYAPAQEIPGWQDFLRRFPRHPGADDAAYRLARCYEIQGKWEEALAWYARALALPDGDMEFDARGRLLFVLDARIPEAKLRCLAASGDVAPELKPLLAYTLAVRELRREDYRTAVGHLGEFLQAYGGPAAGEPGAGGLLPGSPYPFWARVEEQRQRAAQLAELAARPDDPEAVYALGAAIYHDEDLYYNHLWAGGRQGFNWVGHVNELWGEVPEGRAYLEGLMNFQHALRYFQAVEQFPAASSDLKAKALYSQGLAYVHMRHWGQEAEALLNMKEIEEEICATFQRFAATYPESPLVDDALFTLWVYTQDSTYLERILKTYPTGDRAEAARKILSGHAHQSPP